MESMDPSQRSMSQGSMNASLPEPFGMHEMKSFMDKQSRVIILLWSQCFAYQKSHVNGMFSMTWWSHDFVDEQEAGGQGGDQAVLLDFSRKPK